MAITVLDNTFAKVRRIFDNTKSIAAMMTAVRYAWLLALHKLTTQRGIPYRPSEL